MSAATVKVTIRSTNSAPRYRSQSAGRATNECQKLAVRMGMRRFTRLTNAFSKKLKNHAAAVALYCLHNNFARVHKTLHVTPAMEAGIAHHVCSIEEIVGLL